MGKLPGITREEEEEKLRRTIAVAEQKVEANRQGVRALAEELHAMQEEFDESDKEAQTLWHDTDARFKFVNQDLRRAEQARKKPYFGRIDFRDKKLKKDEVYYIGRSVIAENPAEPEVIDWRAPIASVYYDSALGDVTYSVKGEGRYEINLSRKRTYEIEQDRLKDFYDSDVVANDELLTRYLAKNKRAVLGEIIATIQQEQNEVIRKKPQHNLIIQGAAGSGKTTVAMHRISYILYNYELEFAPEDFYIIGSNQVLLNYITGVLPELNVYGVRQMTMEQLFARLLYEDWDRKYVIKPVRVGVTPPVKGTLQWFRDLEAFCLRYEERVIPRGDVCIEKNGVVLLTAEAIRKILDRSMHLSRADKITRLTEHLMAKLENEISGKYYSYTANEKKRLWNYYETYFGKREWKGSIFELYDDFLREQEGKGFQVPLPGKEFDVYDLAALAYLYKRIKEDEVIREAGHVVIDEAQDFGMMAYGALKYCLSKCTYTIMGDVSQNISIDYGLNDWSELRKLMLPGEFDYFGLLRKSYRNTVEISRFATDILYHGSFQIYPVEPIIRHGKEVRVSACADFSELLAQTVSTVREWVEAGLETIAIICADEEEVKRVTAGLEGKVTLLSVGPDRMEFTEGVMALSLEYTKGLEFDAVLLFDASAENYPARDGYVKRLYVAATRALHELVVLYRGELTGLIAEPVPEEEKKKAVTVVDAPGRKPMPQEPEKTKEEIYRQKALEGEAERNMREVYGPRKIEVRRGKAGQEDLQGEGVSADGAAGRNAGNGGRTPGSGQDARRNDGRSSGNAQDARGNGGGAPGNGQGVQGNDGGAPGNVQGVQGNGGRASGNGQDTRRNDGWASGNAQDTPGNRRNVPERTGTVPGNAPETFPGEFGEMPSTSALRPAGHTRIDCAVRFFLKGDGYFDVMSSYGQLRITPLSETVIRICFARGQGGSFPRPEPEFTGSSCRCRFRESMACMEVATEKVLVRVDRKTGALSFLTPQGKALLSERGKEPRLVGTDRVWQFFEWGKEEQLFARDPGNGQPLKIGSSARYVSFGREGRLMPGLASAKGYELRFPAGAKVLCCNVPAYGTYVSEEGQTVIDYYFVYEK